MNTYPSNLKGMKETKLTFAVQAISNVSKTASADVRALGISAGGILMANVYFALVNVWKRKYTHSSDSEIGCAT